METPSVGPADDYPAEVTKVEDGPFASSLTPEQRDLSKSMQPTPSLEARDPEFQPYLHQALYTRPILNPVFLT